MNIESYHEHSQEVQVTRLTLGADLGTRFGTRRVMCAMMCVSLAGGVKELAAKPLGTCR